MNILPVNVKSPADFSTRLFDAYIKLAATYSPARDDEVQSAQSGLTILFGMGRSGSPTL